MTWIVSGSLYIAGAIYSFGILNPAKQILLIVLASISDISAYLLGKWLKGPKLVPRISPNKTWSGAIGSMVVLLIVFPLMLKLIQSHTEIELGLKAGQVPYWSAGVFSIIAQSGDLLQSWCKRKFGVKDSGNLIPGHGGVLDRIDSLLAVTLANGLLMA